MHGFYEHIAINVTRCVSTLLAAASLYAMTFIIMIQFSACLSLAGYPLPIKENWVGITLIGIIAFGPGLFCYIVFPAGDKFLDFKIGARLPSDREKVVLNTIYDRLCVAAKEKHLALPRITLRIQDTSEINAFAYGRSRIMFTSAMLRHYLKDENGIEKLTAVAAHEAGHLRNGDGGFGLIGTLLLGPFNVFIALANNTLGLIPVFSWINYAVCTVVSIPIFISTQIDELVHQVIEYRADDYAARLIGPDQFAEVLAEFAKEDEWRGGGVFATMKRSHPASELRRNRILKRHGLEDASLDISGLTA